MKIPGGSGGKPSKPYPNSPHPNTSTTVVTATNDVHGDDNAKWFTPNVLPSAQKSAELRSNHDSHEQPGQRAHRMSIQQAHLHQTRRRELEKRIYHDPEVYSWRPVIDPISRKLGRKSSVREQVMQQVNSKISEECPFKPKINNYVSKPVNNTNTREAYSHSHRPNESSDSCLLNDLLYHTGHNRDRINTEVSSQSHAVQSVINMKEPERMARDIRLHLREKEEKRREKLAVKEIEELSKCTFQPDTSATSKSYYKYAHAPQPPAPPPYSSTTPAHVSPTSFLAAEQQQAYNSELGYDPSAPPIPGQQQMVIVRGLNRHLELKRLADQLKVEKRDREREVFTVRGVDKYRDQVDNSTIVEVYVMLYITIMLCID